MKTFMLLRRLWPYLAVLIVTTLFYGAVRRRDVGPASLAASQVARAVEQHLSYSVGPVLWTPLDSATAAHDAAEWRSAQQREATSLGSAIEQYRNLVSKGVSNSIWQRKKEVQSHWQGEFSFEIPSAAAQLAWNTALVRGAKRLPIIVAAASPSATAEVRRLIATAQGQTFDCIEQIGYVFGAIPADRLPSLYASEYVMDAGVACSLTLDECLPETKQQILTLDKETLFPSSEQSEESRHPYSLTKRETELPGLTINEINEDAALRVGDEMGMDRWRNRHGTWDGRGTTIAIFDGFAELSHPSLQDAKDRLGYKVAKTAGIIDMDSVDGEPSGSDVPSGSSDEVDFQPHQVPTSCDIPPRPGYRVGFWHSSDLDLCIWWRDSDRSGFVSVPDTNTTRQRFAIPAANPDGTATTTAAVAEAKGPTDIVVTDKDGRLFVHIANDGHTTAVAVAAAGTALRGTKVEGIAPAARVLYISPGHFQQTSMIRGIWDALSRSDVDVASVTSAIASFPDDRQPLLNLLLDRIAATTNKPIVMAAGNDGSILEEASAYSGSYLITVGGAYRPSAGISGSTGSASQMLDIESYSGSGPAVSGSWGLDVVAPADGLTGWSCADVSAPPHIYIVQHRYRTLPCWAAPGGTSIAAPRVAGVLALLLSAARQQGFDVSALELKSALLRGSSLIGGVPAFRQGTGLVNVGSAWEAIREDRRRGMPSVTGSTRDILPLFLNAWRGRREGRSVYVTRGVHTGCRYMAKLELHDQSLTPEDLHIQSQSSNSSPIVLRRTGPRDMKLGSQLLLHTPELSAMWLMSLRPAGSYPLRASLCSLSSRRYWPMVRAVLKSEANWMLRRRRLLFSKCRRTFRVPASPSRIVGLPWATM